jgi:hypothetical protein
MFTLKKFMKKDHIIMKVQVNSSSLEDYLDYMSLNTQNNISAILIYYKRK